MTRDALRTRAIGLCNRGKVVVALILADYVLCSTAYGLIENKGPISSGWWAIVTGFTVGYGDQYPESTAGRGVGALLIVTTWLLSLLAAALFTSRLVQDADQFSHEEQEEIKRQLADANRKLDQLLAPKPVKKPGVTNV